MMEQGPEVPFQYDVIIGGASFAGLAAAVQLHGKRVLLVEPHDIGTVQTSACGTLLAVLQATGTMDSLLQIHDRLLLHIGQRTFEYPVPYSFCTFDYHILCNRLLTQSGAQVLRASVLRHRGHTVDTTEGSFDARILIDATGWRTALTTNARKQAEPHRGRSFGLETTISVAEDGLHFYYDARRLGPFSVGWLFPTGGRSRAGLASFVGRTQLTRTLARFTQDEFGLPPDGRHGGYFPYRRQPVSTGGVFRIGDASGQCIPLTGEGIRPALYFGAMAGRLTRRVLDDEITLLAALRRYRKFVEQRAAFYRYLLVVQKVLPALPMAWIERVADFVRRPEALDPLLRWYWRVVDPDRLALFWFDRTTRESRSWANAGHAEYERGRRTL